MVVRFYLQHTAKIVLYTNGGLDATNDVQIYTEDSPRQTSDLYKIWVVRDQNSQS